MSCPHDSSMMEGSSGSSSSNAAGPRERQQQQHARRSSGAGALRALFACFGTAGGAADGARQQRAARAPGTVAAAGDLAAPLARKGALAGSLGVPGSGSSCGARSCAAAGDNASSSACSAQIPALYEPLPQRSTAGCGASGANACPLDVLSCDAAASTSYPTTSLGEGWDVLGACMTTAREMEACVDAVLDGSIKSAQALFARYDMDLDARLAQQDVYDLCLELGLALPYHEYAKFVDAAFTFADSDGDGFITLRDFVPLYKALAAVRRAFRRQDHHNNGQIDRYDFLQVLLELAASDVAQLCQQQPVPVLAESAFSFADSANRGIVNFGQTLVWYAAHLLACAKHRAASCSQLLLEPA